MNAAACEVCDVVSIYIVPYIHYYFILSLYSVPHHACATQRFEENSRLLTELVHQMSSSSSYHEYKQYYIYIYTTISVECDA